MCVCSERILKMLINIESQLNIANIQPYNVALNIACKETKWQLPKIYNVQHTTLNTFYHIL